MRLISQDGMIDVNYEWCELYVVEYELENESTFTISFTERLKGNDMELAEYSSLEKAMKAMEMLQKAYCPVLSIGVQGNKIIPDIRPGNLTITNKFPTSSVVVNNFYFRFPTEEEMEDCVE